MALEAELKFMCTADISTDLTPLLAQFALVVEERSPVQLLNAYYDTSFDADEQWFRQHDAGLRTRQKNGRFEQTIKLAGQQQGALQVRPEYNLPCEGVWPELGAFPAEIWPEGVSSASLQSTLVQLFTTDFSRKTWLVTMPSGTKVELALDQGYVRTGPVMALIYELELELYSGQTRDLFELAQALVLELPLRLGVQSKAERGYRLYQNQPVTPVEAPSDKASALLLAMLYNEECWLSQHDRTALELLRSQWQALAAFYPDFAVFAKQEPELVLGDKAYVQAQLALSSWLQSNELA